MLGRPRSARPRSRSARTSRRNTRTSRASPSDRVVRGRRPRRERHGDDPIRHVCRPVNLEDLPGTGGRLGRGPSRSVRIGPPRWDPIGSNAWTVGSSESARIASGACRAKQTPHALNQRRTASSRDRMPSATDPPGRRAETRPRSRSAATGSTPGVATTTAAESDLAHAGARRCSGSRNARGTCGPTPRAVRRAPVRTARSRSCPQWEQRNGPDAEHRRQVTDPSAATASGPPQWGIPASSRTPGTRSGPGSRCWVTCTSTGPSANPVRSAATTDCGQSARQVERRPDPSRWSRTRCGRRPAAEPCSSMTSTQPASTQRCASGSGRTPRSANAQRLDVAAQRQYLAGVGVGALAARPSDVSPSSHTTPIPGSATGREGGSAGADHDPGATRTAPRGTGRTARAAGRRHAAPRRRHRPRPAAAAARTARSRPSGTTTRTPGPPAATVVAAAASLVRPSAGPGGAAHAPRAALPCRGPR